MALGQEEFTAEIAAAKRCGDAARLNAVLAALEGRSEAWVNLAKLKAVAARRVIGAESGGGQSVGNAGVTIETPHWLNRYGLHRPDGRPLHRYTLRDDAFALITSDLKVKAARINAGLAIDQDAALYVLWAAEWFRRTYAGGAQRWADVGRPIGVQLEQAAWRRLADRGLKYWRLPELRLNGMHHRLAAIARQGGFPVAAIVGAQSGWAAAFLQKLTARLLSHPSPTAAVAEDLARELEHSIPDLWRHDEIIAVSGELAMAIVELRQHAEAEGVTEGVLVSAWLDREHPSWRQNLPLAIHENGARQLVDGLMQVERLKGGRGAIRARRFLVAQESCWREQVELELDGDLVSSDPTQTFASLARDWSRLRLFACEESAQFISGELALVEPAEEGRWSCAASRTQLRFDLPMHVPLKVELRGEGVRVAGPFVLPGGEAAGRELRVCVGVDAALGDTPTRLEVIGAGSGGYRAEPLFLQTPNSWSVEAHETNSVCREIGCDQSTDRRLWEVCGAALARDEQDDTFLVRAGQTSDQRDQILLSGAVVQGCVAGDGRTLYCGAPTVRFRQGAHLRAPRDSEIWWRRKGEREWRLEKQSRPSGTCEIAWRDEKTLHLRCKTEAIVLPSDFAVQRNVTGSWISLDLEGWPNTVTVSPGEPSGARQWRVHREHTTQSHFEISLTFPDHSLPVAVRTPIRHHAWLYDWSGRRLPRDGQLSLSNLHRFVARAPGRIELWAELLDVSRRPVPQANARWTIDEEMPLSVIADDLATLLRSSGRLDAKVRLDFNDSHSNHWFVVEFEHTLTKESRGLSPHPAVSDPVARIVGRPFAAASYEQDFAPYGEAEQINLRPIAIDPGPGPWLVYLRANDRVLCRPVVINGSTPAEAPVTALGQVMLSGSDNRESQLAALIEETLQDPSSDVSRAVIRSIVELAVSLDGLPPSTFDVFKQLESRPLLGPLMLYGAHNGEIESVLRLANNLRMAWCLIPQRFWAQAWEVWGRHFLSVFPELPGDVAQLMTSKRQALVEHEPTLAPLLGLLAPTPALPAIANSFLNRSADRIRTDVSNPFRARFADHLPNWSFDPKFWRAADAPIVAATVARGEFADAMLADELTAVKDIARNHPRYFSVAFASQFGAR